MTTALSVIRDKISETTGDFWHSTVTTALAASAVLIDTDLAKKFSKDNECKNWYVLVTSENNDGEARKISAYTATSTQITVIGGNFTSDSAAKATYELHKFDPDDKERAINYAAEDIYPILHRVVRDRTLVTGNALPNAHFEDWVVTTYPDKYGVTNATAAETATAGLTRGGGSSALVTASANDGYMYITSNDYPQLLDLMGQTITFRCWAYPSVASDAFLTIYTIQADGTEQTLNSTSPCPASKYSLLELESQAINDNITEIQFRFRVHTDAETCYFDNARVTGVSLQEYLLPADFRDGHLSKVYVQSSGLADQSADDLHLTTGWTPLFGWNVRTDNGDKFLQTPYGVAEERNIQLEGFTKFETLSLDTDTISLDGEKLNLLISQAIVRMYEMRRGLVASDSVNRYDDEIGYWRYKVEELKGRHRMNRPASQIRWTS